MLELLCGRRQNENADQVAARFLTELLGALPINIKQNVAPRLQSLYDRPARRAIAMAENLRPFEKFAMGGQVIEAGGIDKMIIAAVDLAFALWPRRDGY